MFRIELPYGSDNWIVVSRGLYYWFESVRWDKRGICMKEFAPELNRGRVRQIERYVYRKTHVWRNRDHE